MEESKENTYFACGCTEECYLNSLKSHLYRIARQINKPEDWKKVTLLSTLINCFNADCLMCKEYKRTMEKLKSTKN